MQEYKGIYYGDDNEQKFYEGGAHFKYKSLYQILELICLEQSANQFKESQSFKNKNLSSKNIKNSTIINKTRNILTFADYNYKTETNNFKKINENSNSKPKTNYSKNILDSKLKLNIKYNKINQNFSTKVNKLQKKIKKDNFPKKIINSRNSDFSTYRANPNSLFKKNESNILFNKKNRQSSMSLHEIKTNNKSTNKSTNKTNNKSIIYSYKKSFPDLKNILNNNLNDELTVDRGQNKKIKVDLKKINKIIKPNISSIEVENSKTFRDNSHCIVESLAKNNLNQSKSKTNSSFLHSNDINKKQSDNRIIELKNKIFKDTIQNKLEKNDSKNINIKIKTTDRFHNFTQQKKIKVKNRIKKNNNNNKISIAKKPVNNIQNIIEIINTKNKKYPININSNPKKSRNYEIGDIAYNTGTINQKKNGMITSNSLLNECFKTFIINNNKQNGIIKNAINVNYKKSSIMKNKLYKLNNSMGFSNVIVNNKIIKKIKMNNNQISESNGNSTARENRKITNKINCVNNNKMKISSINLATKTKKYSLNNIRNNPKIKVNKNLNKNFNINKKGIISQRLIREFENNK